MILEAIVTTLNDDESVNIAPMGPRVADTMDRFVLRPFRTSTTCRNLLKRGEGVLHVTDDALLFARTAIGDVDDSPTRAAESVQGRVILSASRYYEFQVSSRDEASDRVSFNMVTTAKGRFRDLFGFNRAKHAVIEASILATRTEWIPMDQIEREYEKLSTIIEKTGGGDELRAMELLIGHVRAIAISRGRRWEFRSPCLP